MKRRSKIPAATARLAAIRSLAIGGLILLGGCNQMLPLRPPAGSQETIRAVALLQRGDRTQAIQQLDAAIKAADGDARTAVQITAVCAELRDWDLATRYGEIALKQTPKADHPARWAAYGAVTSAYIGLGQKDKAIKLAREGYDLDPEDPSAMNLLGYVYADIPVLEKLPEALDLTQRAVNRSTTEGRSEEETATYLDSVGWVKYQQGRVDEAVTDLVRAAYAIPRQPEVLYHLGKAYFKKGRYEDAAVAFQRAVKISPRFIEAEQAYKETAALIPPKPDLQTPVSSPSSSNSAPNQPGSTGTPANVPRGGGETQLPPGPSLPAPNP